MQAPHETGMLAQQLQQPVAPVPAPRPEPLGPTPVPHDMGESTTNRIYSEARGRERALIAEVRETELTIDIEPRTSKVLKTKRPVNRVSITHPQILEIVQFGPTELELIGLMPGETSMTLWFEAANGQGEREMLRYTVRVGTNDANEDRRRLEYAKLERKINELFPNSFVHLFAIGDKLIVRGQARDSRESMDILSIVREGTPDVAGGVNNRNGYGGNGYGAYGAYGGYGAYGNGYGAGYAGNRNASAWLGNNIINMLDVPGEKQVLLKVRVAELTRSAARDIGTNLNLNFGDFSLSTSFGLSGAVSAVLSSKDVGFTMAALASNGYSKILAEPNLVTLSGHPASFVSGGSFAVPTTVGVQGVGAVSTTFQNFGTQLMFTPTVLDKDRIRLQVSPTVSSPDKSNTVNGIPGLTERTVSTTVDLRAGQWLAIAGLIQDQQDGTKNRIPWLGDIPVAGFLFGQRHVDRDETELLILVSPELVHPLEAEESPLILPGMEVTEPTDCAFYVIGDYEGRPNVQHRSTVSPLVRQQQSEARWDAKRQPEYQSSENHYLQGPHGFSD